MIALVVFVGLVAIAIGWRVVLRRSASPPADRVTTAWIADQLRGRRDG